MTDHSPTPPILPDDWVAFVIQFLDEKMAQDIVHIPLKGMTALADDFVVASGTSTRHLIALAENLQIELKKYDVLARVEGRVPGLWVVMDAGRVVVHLFRPETRALYNLEDLWQPNLPKV